MKSILIFLFPVLSFSQVTHMKSVTVDVKDWGQYDLIEITFYRGSKIGFDLATHNGDFIGKCEVKAIKSSDCVIDSLAAMKIIRAFNAREERRRHTQSGQAIVGGASILLIKSIADSKLNWK